MKNKKNQKPKKAKTRGPSVRKEKIYLKNKTPKKKKTNAGRSDMALAKPDLLQRYLWEIREYDLLTKEEEEELARRVKEEGDRKAAHRLVTSNLRLVVKIALQFQGIWMHNFLDLVQEGNVGLMHAVRKFDRFRKVRFSYYAAYWIRAYILRFVMDHWRLVRIGTTQAQRKLFFRLNKEKRQLKAQGFDPKPNVLAKRLGVTEKEVSEMDQRLNLPEVSLDASIKEESEETRLGFIPSDQASVEDEVARKQIKATLHEKLVGFRETCNERELDILENRLLSEMPLTLQQIGTRYGISKERVRQIQVKVLAKLKSHFEREIPGFSSLQYEVA
jgi:RNA polymerase sigma-32 factor